MRPELSKDKLVEFDPPIPGQEPAENWAERIVDNLLTKTKGGKVATFLNFPPECFDYYQALQVKIAELKPEEQDRPYIAVQIRGKDRVGHSENKVDVGLAGGTGPLSDAKVFEGLVLRRANKTLKDLKNDPEKTRAELAEGCKSFSGVLFSMPPPRDFKHVFSDLRGYRDAYATLRAHFPHKTLHILTNTGHLNINLFRDPKCLGGAEGTKIIDMTKQIAFDIETRNVGFVSEGIFNSGYLMVDSPNSKNSENSENSEKAKILVLGTTHAAEKKLYPNLLGRFAAGVLPETRTGEKNQQKLLQEFIDRAKKGELDGGSQQHKLGEAFINFVIEHVTRSEASELLFSCTEIPLILAAQETEGNDEGKTFADILKTKLEEKFSPKTFEFHDTEHLFIEIIDKTQMLLANDHGAESDFSGLDFIDEHSILVAEASEPAFSNVDFLRNVDPESPYIKLCDGIKRDVKKYIESRQEGTASFTGKMYRFKDVGFFSSTRGGASVTDQKVQIAKDFLTIVDRFMNADMSVDQFKKSLQSIKERHDSILKFYKVSSGDLGKVIDSATNKMTEIDPPSLVYSM